MSNVPNFQQFMMPTLRTVADGDPHATRDVAEAAADLLALPEEVREVRISSGGPAYLNKAFWAQSYLFQAGLLVRPRRGVVQITEAGRALLNDPPRTLDAKYLARYPSFVSFKARTRAGVAPTNEATTDDTEASPEELLEQAVATNEADVASQLSARIQSLSPAAFERLVLRLLVALGYGTEATAIHAGKSGDEGIDGIINRDALGLDRVYMQAKRYTDNAVGPESINAFYGALQRKGADRGVFITSSTFTPGARRAEVDFRNIVLIDGEELARLMIKHDVGVEITATRSLKRVNEDFFDDL